MWIVAGVLLGVVVLASLAGLHAGPHAHLAAGWWRWWQRRGSW